MISPLIVDVEGTELTQDDRRRIRSVLCGGVILFRETIETEIN